MPVYSTLGNTSILGTSTPESAGMSIICGPSLGIAGKSIIGSISIFGGASIMIGLSCSTGGIHSILGASFSGT